MAALICLHRVGCPGVPGQWHIEQAFAAAGVSLFPASRRDLKTDCSCPDPANPCKHIAAVYYLLGEQFDADPFLLFRLRGKSKDDIMVLLRARRSTTESVQSPVTAEGNPPVVAQESAEPLDASLDHFWVCAESLDDLVVFIQSPAVDAAPIKRLGVPGFWHSKMDFLAAMTQIIRVDTKRCAPTTGFDWACYPHQELSHAKNGSTGL